MATFTSSDHLVDEVADVDKQMTLNNQDHKLSDTDSELNYWLKSLGLHFNPFFALNAADDPHLSEYLIGNEVFNAVWGDWISFVFEPAGGGKTALRVQTAHSCWDTQDINRPFPIPYNPPFLKWGMVTPTYDDHLEALTLAGTEQLLLALSHRPHWFLDNDLPTQKRVCELLTWELSAETLSVYLDELNEAPNLSALKQELDPTFSAPDPPDSTTLQKFCSVLKGLIVDDLLIPNEPATHWEALGDLLLNGLKFPAIYILLDSLDATLETAGDPKIAVACVASLFSLLFDWSKQHIYLKGFLPIETKQVFYDQFPWLTKTRVASIDWDEGKLAEVVRERVYVASQGQFNSLDAIATPGLRDFEDILTESIVALRPREMLTLINEVLVAHVRHSGGVGKIEEKDWKVGLHTYQRDVFPQNPQS